MKLSNSMRSAFIRSVMDDVPSIDYQEQAEKLIHEYALSLLPAPLRRALEINPALKCWLVTNYQQAPYGLGAFYTYKLDGINDDLLVRNSALRLKMDELAELSSNQRKARSALTDKLRDASNACSTRKQLLQALPEFEKYMPAAPDAKTGNLPATINLVTDLVAAGWPKNKPVEKLNAANDSACNGLVLAA